MKDEVEETAKMIFQAFNIHPAERWENGRFVNPNAKTIMDRINVRLEAEKK